MSGVGGADAVSVLPGGASAAAEEGARLGYEDQLVRNAISADGSRVFFEAARPEGHLYMRDVPRNESAQLDAPEAGAGGGEGRADVPGCEQQRRPGVLQRWIAVDDGRYKQRGKPGPVHV